MKIAFNGDGLKAKGANGNGTQLMHTHTDIKYRQHSFLENRLPHAINNFTVLKYWCVCVYICCGPAFLFCFVCTQQHALIVLLPTGRHRRQSNIFILSIHFQDRFIWFLAFPLTLIPSFAFQ